LGKHFFWRQQSIEKVIQHKSLERIFVASSLIAGLILAHCSFAMPCFGKILNTSHFSAASF
jgi:hypothetical protein